MLNLEGTDVERPVVAVHVQQELRGVTDRAGRVRGVTVPEQPEVGDGLEIVQVGTGEREEVAEHLVGVPVDGEVGEAVEEVEGAPPRLLDHAMDVGNEVLEAVLRLQVMDLGPEVVRKEWLVLGEAEVDQPPPGAHGRLAVGLGEGQVVLDPVHLPDDIVAGEDALQQAVEPAHTRRHSRTR